MIADYGGDLFCSGGLRPPFFGAPLQGRHRAPLQRVIVTAFCKSAI